VTREQLVHVLRAACRLTRDPYILVVGSQAILGSYDSGELPEKAWISMEADLVFIHEAGDPSKAEIVNGAIGELSQFHVSNNYYAQGVDMATATLPDGWQHRLEQFRFEADQPPAVCLEKHDLVISKLAAMREKDKEFSASLLDAGLVDVAILLSRVNALTTVAPRTRNAVRAWIEAEARRLHR
jgi:hypothetical protein